MIVILMAFRTKEGENCWSRRDECQFGQQKAYIIIPLLVIKYLSLYEKFSWFMCRMFSIWARDSRKQINMAMCEKIVHGGFCTAVQCFYYG